MAVPNARITIVGCGIIGSSTAYYLSRHPKAAGATITLVEAFHPAAGTSGNSGGFLAKDWHGPATASLAELSFRLHEDLANEHDGVKEWGYRKIDTLLVSCDATAKKGKSVLPWLESKVTLRSSVIGTKETTAQVHPRLMTKKLAQLSEQKGVKIHVGTATRIELDSDGKPRELVVQSSGGVEERLPTDCLVIAAGAWSGRLAKSLLGPKGHRIAVDGHRAHSIVVKSDELTPHAIFTQIRLAHGTAEPEVYCRPDGTAYICGAGDNSPLPPTAGDVKPSPEAIQSLKDQAAILSPKHLTGEVLAEQACYLPMPAEGTPLVGKVMDGIYVAAGHSCWGITLGPGTGKVMSEMILDGKARSADVEDLSP